MLAHEHHTPAVSDMDPVTSLSLCFSFRHLESMESRVVGAMLSALAEEEEGVGTRGRGMF